MTVRRLAGASFSALAAALFISSSADAAVVISSKATKNMTCANGVCTPTRAKAVLNVTDLANMLASGDVKVISDSRALDINFAESLSWTSTSRLTLDSYQSIIFEKPVTVAGTGALTITTNDGGTGGDFWFEKKGHIEFWDLHSKLLINGGSYMLVRNIRQLAKAIAKNSSGCYALSRNYNAANDGTYSQSPISITFTGTFEGLGNRISNLSVNDPTDSASVGLFAHTGKLTHNVNLSAVSVSAGGANATAGGLAGGGGNISHSSVSGSVFGSRYAGGLIGVGAGLYYSQSSVSVTTANGIAGGLVGDSVGEIQYSYATGPVSGGDDSYVGGLIGLEEIEGQLNLYVYATGAVTGGSNASVGGLVGFEPLASMVSYSTGAVSSGPGSYVGGFYGVYGSGCLCSNYDYWDMQTSGTDQGTGNEGNVRGVVGLKTDKFKSELPIGFDPTIWAQRPNVNDGYPYLLNNPPE